MTKRIISTQKMNTSPVKRKRIMQLFTTTSILLFIALFAWQCKTDDFTGETVGVCPTIILTSPVNGAINVVTNKIVTAKFNERMDPASINSSTFLVKQGTALVAGDVTYNDSTATFTPRNLLAANTVYTATVTRLAKDPDGNIMPKDSTWSFNTGDTPMVMVTSPQNGDIDVALNKLITVDFSTTMDPTTINETTFFVKNGTTTVSGGVSYVKQQTTAIQGKISAAGLRATFTPTGGFDANTIYTVTVSKNVKDLAGNAMAKDTTFSFSTGILPVVVLTNPLNAAINVPLDKKIQVTFNKTMNDVSLSSATFTVKDGTNGVLGIVAYTGLTATFTPTTDLAPNTEYTATITTDALDLAGNSMLSNYVWKFTTGSIANVSRPTVITTDPSNGALNVPLNKIINADFSKIMDQSTITTATFKVNEGTNIINGAVSYSGVTAVFTPLLPLSSNKSYTATITTGAKDIDGNALATNYVWSFTTGATLQLSVELSSNPIAGGSTIGGGSFNTGASVTVVATPNNGYSFLNWTEDGESVSPSKSYTFLINDNRILVANFNPITAGPLALNLDCSTTFGIVAGSAISSTGPSIINGDVALSPGSALNGFPPGTVNGTKQITTPIAASTKLCLTSAYLDGMSRSLNAISLPGQLGGLTLAPGLYVNSSTSGISGTGSNAELTLDAGGNPNATWIFKMGSTFITSAGTKVKLAGGAQAKNIFWVIGTSATLGTNSVMYGTILAQASITLTTGSTLYGRALTQIGAVTLDASTITVPQ